MTSVDFTEALIDERPVTVRRRVLWGECDPAAVVYTPRFVDYTVSARDWFCRIGLGLLDRPHPARPGLSYPMRAMSFDFLSFLKADDWFDMTVFVMAISARTFTIEIVAAQEDGKRIFRAQQTSVCVDTERGRAAALPESVRAALIRYRDDVPPRTS